MVSKRLQRFRKGAGRLYGVAGHRLTPGCPMNPSYKSRSGESISIYRYTTYLITVGTNASIMPITSEARNAPKIDTLIPGTRY